MGMAPGLAQNLSQARIAGRFYDSCSPLAEQELRTDPDRVLGAHCNEHVFRSRRDSAARQNVAQDVFDEERVVVFVLVGREEIEILLA